MSPASLEKAKELLAKGGTKQFMPSGFGTGYALRKRRRTQWDVKGSHELAAFFGLGEIYYEKIDCD